jgi:hypothetical protein
VRVRRPIVPNRTRLTRRHGALRCRREFRHLHGTKKFTADLIAQDADEYLARHPVGVGTRDRFGPSVGARRQRTGNGTHEYTLCSRVRTRCNWFGSFRLYRARFSPYARAWSGREERGAEKARRAKSAPGPKSDENAVGPLPQIIKINGRVTHP